MSAIKLGPFGGVHPSVGARSLPESGAQVAENLSMRFGDFRPLKGAGASVASVASGAKSVHRTPTSGVWLSSANHVHYVNGQINDPAVERVYLTGRSAYPEVWESSAYRRLGVPAPTTAPTLAKNVVDEYTTAERSASLTQYYQSIRTAVLANITETAVCAAMPGAGWNGSSWYANGSHAGLPSTSAYQVNYAAPMTGSTTTTASEAYLLNPVLAGVPVTISSVPNWVVKTNWRARSYSLNQSALVTALTALLQPDGSTPLVPNTEATEIAARIAAITDVTKDPMRSLVDTANMWQNEIKLQLSRSDTDPSRAYALNSAAVSLNQALAAIDEYIQAWDTPLGDILGDYTYLVPKAVELIEKEVVYYFTYVTAQGEESAPSPPSVLLTVDQNDTVTVTKTGTPPTSPYGTVTTWRVYRGSTLDGQAAYQYVSEAAIGTATLLDDKTQDELGEVCPTEKWHEPMDTLEGLVGLPNGVMAGFSGKTLAFSEPYTPYAWPSDYRHTLEFNIVALSVFGQTLVVLTEGNVYYATGADSASMLPQKMENPQACVSARSVASGGAGVLFASPDGVCMAGGAGVQVISSGKYSRTDWLALTPSSSYGAVSDGVYYLALPAASRIDMFDLATGQLSTMALGGSATTLHVDLLTDTLYIAEGTSLLPQFTGTALTGRWKSPVTVTHGEMLPSWAQITGPVTSATLKLYADGVLYYTTPAVTSERPVRLPAKRAETFEAELTSTGRAEQVLLAYSSKELA